MSPARGDASQAAPATAMDSLPVRQLSLRITPAMLWLPVLGVAAALILTNLPEPPGARTGAPVAAQNAAGLDAPVAAADDDDGDEPGDPDEPGEPDQPDDDSDDPNVPTTPPPPTELSRPLAQVSKEQAHKLELAAARSEVKVTMYYTDWCQRCLEARGYLAGRGIKTELRDIEKDPKAKAKHRKLNPKGSVPTIVVEGKVQVGFQQQKLDRAIDKAARRRVARKR
jgi:glutaredoxin